MSFDPARVDWRREPLPPQDVERLRAVRWNKVAFEEAIAVLEGWNAGVPTAAMAAVTGASAATYRILLGKLKQLGAHVRPADPERAERERVRGLAARERAQATRERLMPRRF